MKTRLNVTTRHDGRPQRNRLRKTALAFLAAATAAFFAAAPAGAIEITAMTSSSSETIEGDSSHYIMLYTDVGYAYVQWFVKGADSKETLVRTNTGTGLGTFDYLSGYDYDGLGSTTGNKVTVKAVAYRNADNHDDHDTETVEITVWKAIASVKISHMNDVVAGEQFTLRARTDQPFHTVQWFLRGKRGDVLIAKATSDYDGDRYAAAPYTFQSGQGSSERAGKKHVIIAVAYPLEPENPRNDRLKAASDESRIFVHEEKGKSCRSVTARFDIFEIDDDDMCAPYWVHGISYYNDEEGETADLYAYCKMYRLREMDDGEIPDPVWFRDHEMAHYHAPDGGEDGTPYILNLELKYRHTILDPYGVDGMGVPHIHEKLEKGRRYYAVVDTRLNKTDEWDNEARNASVTTVPFLYEGHSGWIMPSYHHHHNPTFEIHPKRP